MTKKKTFFIFAAAFFLNFCLSNTSFAIVDVELKSKYPDYAYEFTGKDTCERFNRKIFAFNSKINKFIIRPINTVWASVMPKYGMERIQNGYTNLEFPIRLVSCMLQKDFKSSRSETVRFLTNTTLGIGGLYDPAKTQFKIEPRQEDMGQVLAHYNVKKGPYLVLPIVAFGNVRDIAGQVLDCPLNPTSYVIGPVALIAKSVSLMNKTTYMQSLAKTIDYTYADPYDVTKKLCGIDKYIKNSNLDRKEVLASKMAAQSMVKLNTPPDNSELQIGLNPAIDPDLKADIKLDNYNPQSPIIDSLRTAMFDDNDLNSSIWSEMSVWNKCFSKRIKNSSVKIYDNHPKYKYRYILQPNKNAPLAILYPSIGEGYMSHHSAVLAKILYEKGYSVMIQGSSFQWEFVESMPDDYRPGYPAKDANYLRIVTGKILKDIETKKGCKFDKKILIGTSFGALTTLFVASQEADDKALGKNTLNISNYISVNPPIDILFALKQVDKYSQDWRNNPEDIKMRAAVTAEKVIQMAQNMNEEQIKKQEKNSAIKVVKNSPEARPEGLPFTEDEGKLIIEFIMQQKLSDLVYTIENCSHKQPQTSKKCDLYAKINNMSYDDYARKYLLIDDYTSPEQLSYDTSLYSLANFLQKNDNYKIYHSLDDYYANAQQLAWLKKQTSNKSVFFSNGSHLGELYRKEFIDEFKKDITLESAQLPKKL